jgi:hypothetical protein
MNHKGGNNMVKKAIIEVMLVEESSKKTNKEIEKEISLELSENLHTIPWAAKVEKMTVTES